MPEIIILRAADAVRIANSMSFGFTLCPFTKRNNLFMGERSQQICSCYC